MRLSVSHVTRFSPNASHAGKTWRRSTFGEIGLPEPVEKTNASGLISLLRGRHSATNWSAASDNGIRRTPACVFGVSNRP